jgi:4-carboxymuconolactone decarboxylase
LFEFVPVMDEFLKTHLFGDIFERDNLDWADREIATIAMLSALPGVESQLQSHIGIGMNAGLTVEQMRTLARVLDGRVGPDAARRAHAALQARPLGSSER